MAIFTTSVSTSPFLTTSLVCLCLLVRACLGPFPRVPAAVCLFLFGFLSLGLVGLHVALTCVRYLTVTSFTWIQPQDARQLGRKIKLIVGAITLALMTLIMPLRVPAHEVISFEGYLSGLPAHRINRQLWPAVIGCTSLMAAVNLYLVSKWILQRRAAARIQSEPATADNRVKTLVGYIDVKTLVIGSFYTPVCYVLKEGFEHIHAIPGGVTLVVAMLALNSSVLLYLATRPVVWAHFKAKMRHCAAFQALQDWALGLGWDFESLMSFRVRNRTTVFTVFPPSQVSPC